MGTPLPLDRVTTLALDPGAQVVLDGSVTTSVDGTTFGVPDLFDLAWGGLHVVQHPGQRGIMLARSDGSAPGCVAAGVAAPCLVPRIGELSHSRLRTTAEFLPTLAGSIEVRGTVSPPPPGGLDLLGLLAILAAVSIALVSLWAWVRSGARSALGRIRVAARAALRATQRDATLERVRREIRAMVSRAASLDVARRECARKLARIDRAALERRREAAAHSTSPDAPETLAWLTAECTEAEQLSNDLASSVLGLQRIESALRVVALRAREHRGTRARIERGDPVDLTAVELSIRDEALVEAERALHS